MNVDLNELFSLLKKIEPSLVFVVLSEDQRIFLFDSKILSLTLQINENYIEILNLNTLEKLNGLGSSIIKVLIDFFKKNSFEKLVALSTLDQSKEFWEKLNFKNVKNSSYYIELK